MRNIVLFVSILILPISSIPAETVFNGDVIQGRQVITKLDVSDLDVGMTHEFFFRAGGENNSGQYYYVPVSVVRGLRDGKRIIFVAGVHANEMNSYLTAHLIKSELNPSRMSGTVTIVHQFNIPGLIGNIREFVPSGPVKVNENLNRQANTTTRKTSGQRYSYSLWNDLLKDNADYAIDMHTANPTTFPLFAYANLSIEEVKRMTTLFGPDVSFNSHSKTTVAGAFNEIDVPAFTLEIGAREAFEPELVNRAVSGAINFLTYTGNLSGEFTEHQHIRETNEWVEIYAENGGFIVPKVEMMSDVDAGETLFVQYDAFGHIVQEYESPVSGILVQVIQTPMAEAGTQLGAVVYFNPDKNIDDNLGAGSITIKPEFSDKEKPIS